MGHARRHTGRPVAPILMAALVAGVLAGCSGAGASPSVGLPTFAATVPTSDPARAPLDPCAALIAPADVAGVLGLDPAQTDVRTVRGVPAPAVGRTEKLDCTYTAEKGRPLFTVRAATYATPEAARQQWQLNAGLENGDRHDITVGTATGVLFVRRGELLLTVVDGPKTLAVQLPDRAVPKGRARENLVTDLAQRALKIDPAAAVGSPVGAPGAAPTPVATGG
ncbi:hypothetical protein ACQEVB_28890 [Pseudonocardia sp. CA-107938]|uniref:hypothetical protein n=1 Tax=Pseudonocardia sp. CA-107938 TaxID=3240021 RepID=UPI003D8A5BB5